MELIVFETYVRILRDKLFWRTFRMWNIRSHFYRAMLCKVRLFVVILLLLHCIITALWDCRQHHRRSGWVL